MNRSLSRSRTTGAGSVLGVAIACCATLLGGCGRATEPGTEPTSGGTSAAPASGADDVAAADWPSYNRTLAGDRFSPLAEIDRGNVAQLQVVCTYVLPEANAMQAGPIVVAGTMYFTTDRGSYAIDAATCAQKWHVERVSSRPSPLGAQRGFAYLDGRLFRGTSDTHVLALDAADGRTLWDRTMDVAETPGVSMPMAPIAASGLVFIGNAGGDQTGVTGHVYALDAQDGHVVWKFDVVPDEPTVRATWPNADRYPITGGAFWTSFALDAERGVLYVPAGNPAPDFDLAARGGDNLYTNSLIALDAATGRLLGYNQLVKRDEHDWDVNAPPALGVTRAGRQIVASANKDGLLSVLDRSALDSAQPPPTGADLGARLPTVFQSATTTRENVDVPLSRTARVRFCPGIQGGNEWNGAAFHPQLNTLYTGAVDWCANVQLAAEISVPSAGAIWFGSGVGEIQGPTSEAKGWITAFDADTGAERWKFAAPAPVVAAVTPTAGGLVFTADLTGHIRAFDAESGAVLFALETGQSIGGGIVSYSAAGKQRIGVASGMKSGIWPGAATESRILVLGLPASQPAPTASANTTCNRACLNELAKSYLAAVVAGNPSAVPLAADVAFVENVTRMKPGEGLWANAASGPTGFAIYVPDTELQQVGFLGVMEREGAQGNEPVIVAVRLKLEGGAITEAEHIVAAANANNMGRLRTPRPGLLADVPAGKRQSYVELGRIGLSYYDALDDNDGSLMPFADDCQRHENGMITAGPEAGQGPNADPNRAPVARLCGPQLDSKSFVYIDRIENRRLIAADPVTGLAMGFSHFRHPFTNLPYDVIHTDGSKSQRNKDNMRFNPFDMPAAHIFKIGADGLVHEIEAVGFVAPYNSPTGWE